MSSWGASAPGRLCRDCGAVYSTSWYYGDTCDNCGGALYIRDDDTEETVVKRFSVYQEQTAPLVEHYESKGCLIPSMQMARRMKWQIKSAKRWKRLLA